MYAVTMTSYYSFCYIALFLLFYQVVDSCRETGCSGRKGLGCDPGFPLCPGIPVVRSRCPVRSRCLTVLLKGSVVLPAGAGVAQVRCELAAWSLN